MYSLMSMRVRAFSSLNRNSARALASSVLPTPVGPTKRKEPRGLFGSESPARLRRMASATALTAGVLPDHAPARAGPRGRRTSAPRRTASWTRECPSRSRRRGRCPPRTLPREGAAPPPLSLFSWALSSSSFFCASRSRPYLISAALARSPSRSRFSPSILSSSMRGLELAQLLDLLLLALPAQLHRVALEP